MSPIFDPEQFPDRVIFRDTTVSPPLELMNCLGCGKMAHMLFKNEEFCEACYRQWSLKFCKEWLRLKFGMDAAG